MSLDLETIAKEAQTTKAPSNAAANIFLEKYGLQKQGFQAETITHSSSNTSCTRVSNGNTNYIILEDKVNNKYAKDFFFGVLEQYGHNTEFIFTGKEYGRAMNEKSAARRTLAHYTEKQKQTMITPTKIEKLAEQRAKTLQKSPNTKREESSYDIAYLEDDTLATYSLAEVIADRTKSLQEKPENHAFYEQRKALDTYRIKSDRQALHGELDPTDLYRKGLWTKVKEFPRANGCAIGTKYDAPLTAQERKNEKARAARRRASPKQESKTPSMF